VNAHPAFPGIALVDIETELRRELAARRKLYPDRIRQGRMNQEEADHGIAVFAALLADCERLVPPRRSREETHKFTWQHRRAALVRELDFRAHVYPEWIASGRLDQAEADRRCRCLTALVWIFDDGFDWRGSNGSGPAFHKITPSTAELVARLEWEDHWAAVEAERHPPSQEELAL
jgi:hypothetical protein